MMSKEITLLVQMGIFNNKIREWRRQTTDQKTCAKFKIFFHQSHQDQRRAVITKGKGGYTVRVQKYMVHQLPLQKSIMRR